jgi:Reverse transcriptase (RNA-dependent DNA polymerase).
MNMAWTKRLARLLGGRAAWPASECPGQTEEGVAQGGPLSPSLGNIVLDELERRLAQRGHGFTRHAGTCAKYSLACTRSSQAKSAFSGTAPALGFGRLA